MHRPALPPRRLARALLLLAGAGVLAGTTGVAVAAPAPPSGRPDLGPNVLVFTPSMPTSQIQAAVDAVAAKQVPNQFGTERYALLFEPGTYGADVPLVFQVGYYTEVAGLGRSPGDVTINGHVDVLNQCETLPDTSRSCTALNNFWRSVSNLTINAVGSDGCRASAEFWAVSQAAPVRRVDVRGAQLSFMDYCSGPSFASGGFMADSRAAGPVVNGSQQQFLVRNSVVSGWSNGVWNQVFAGVQGAPTQSFPDPTYTTLTQAPVSKEKPYLYLDAKGREAVFVPAAQRFSSGPTWTAGPTAGRSVPIGDFYVARPGDRVATINAQLARGKDLLFSPGVYDVDRTIQVKRPGTVVLGLGMATLTAVDGVVPMTVADVGGVDVAGVTFDAGSTNSPVLLQVGAHRRPGQQARPFVGGPTALQDVFFRIGGPHLGKASVSLEVNSDGVLLDDVWAWPADHGTGVGWTLNTADTGVVVNGDRVTATGLFVEHYQKDEVVWNGEDGRTVFFQNEMPYDAPDQASWSRSGQPGYPAYVVGPTVRRHEAWGLGSYIFTNVDPTLHSANGFLVPRRPGVELHDLLTVSLNGAGTIDHVINGVGTPVTPDLQGPSTVVSYP